MYTRRYKVHKPAGDELIKQMMNQKFDTIDIRINWFGYIYTLIERIMCKLFDRITVLFYNRPTHEDIVIKNIQR